MKVGGARGVALNSAEVQTGGAGGGGVGGGR